MPKAGPPPLPWRPDPLAASRGPWSIAGFLKGVAVGFLITFGSCLAALATAGPLQRHVSSGPATVWGSVTTVQALAAAPFWTEFRLAARRGQDDMFTGLVAAATLHVSWAATVVRALI